MRITKAGNKIGLEISRIHHLLLFIFAVLVLSTGRASAEDYSKYPFWNTSLPIEDRVKDLVSRLTLEEKIQQVYAEAPAVPRIGLKSYVYGNEALHGILGTRTFTVFPQAIAMASTWDPDLIHQITTAISDEAWGYINSKENKDGYPGGKLRTFWSPTINMARDPRWGRTPETYGEDPYLTSRLAVAFVKGLQGDDPKYIKTVSTPKHFAANNEDHNRTRCNAVISERTLREYYFPAFQAGVMEGGALSVMGAYNAINGVPCCANHWMLVDVLRGDWGFNGYVTTDCGAPESLVTQHKYSKTWPEAAAATINSGIDVECGGARVLPKSLMESVKQGLVTEEAIDLAVSNLMRVRMRLGMFDPPTMVQFTKISPKVIGSKEHVRLARQASRESIVLLKNDKKAGALLPINDNKVRKIAVIGYNADQIIYGDYSGTSPNKPVSPVDGIRARAGKVKVLRSAWIQSPKENELAAVPAGNLRTLAAGSKEKGITAEYYSNPKFEGTPAVRVDQTPEFRPGNLPGGVSAQSGVSVRWKGKIIPSMGGLHYFSMDAGGGYHVVIGGLSILEREPEKSKKKKQGFAKGKPIDNYSLTVQEKRLPIGAIFMEAGREYEITVDYYSQTGSGAAVFKWMPPSARQAKARIDEMRNVKGSDLVIAVMGYRLENEHEGLDRPSLDIPEGQTEYVKAVMAINPRTVVVLMNGSPLTINWIAENVPSIVELWYPGEQGGNALADVLFGDYNPAGRLPFTFYNSMDDLPPFNDYEISKGRTYMYYEKTPIFPFGFGLSYTTFEYSNLRLDKSTAGIGDTIKVSVDVRNTGDRDGDEVAQLYVRDVEASVTHPLKQLKGFRRIHLKRGETGTVDFNLKMKDLGYWNDDKKGFVVEPGMFEIFTGSSSADMRLKASFEVR